MYLQTITQIVKLGGSGFYISAKKCSLYGGVHPRGVRYVHALCVRNGYRQKYNVQLTSQIYLIF